MNSMVKIEIKKYKYANKETTRNNLAKQIYKSMANRYKDNEQIKNILKLLI